MAAAPKKLRNSFNLVAASALAFGALIGAHVGVNKATEQTFDVTINGTDTALMHKGEGFGFTKTVYETDKGTLKNTFSLVSGKFNSKEIEQQLETGKSYTVTVQGMRIDALGVYPNIVKATPKTPTAK